MKPLPVPCTLSVIVPVFNERATAQQALDALLAKEIPSVNIEVVIVESNSTDGSREIVLSYRDHPRVKLILEDRPRGKGHAVRAGFADRAADVAIALTELVANAQQHGDPPFHVESWWDGRLVIEVSNHGTGIGDVVARRDRPPASDEVRGRGLWLVRNLVDVVDVRSGAERTVVRVELSPEPHIGA